MGPIPFAFSVSHFINSVGAKAGFASIIGLAVLVLLYFAQARETSSLREQAYEAAQRIQQLEARISQVARQPAPAAQPASAPAGVSAQPLTRPAPAAVPVGVGSPVPVPAMAAAPAAPAGVGAPALTAATRLIPDSASARAPAAPATPAPVVADEASSVPIGPGPATVAGGANGTAQTPLVPSAQSAVAPEQPPPRIQIRPAAAAAAGRRPPAPPPRPPVRSGSSTGRRVLVALLVALSIGAVVAALLVLTSGSGSSSSSSTSTSAASNAPSPTRHRKASTGVTPSSVTVAVLNGTATSGLAHRVAVKLAATGYKQGTVATATDQTRTATVVAYMPGHRKEAVSVAGSLKLGAASVQPLDPNTQAVACPPPGACTSGVVVTVGSNLANIQ